MLNEENLNRNGQEYGHETKPIYTESLKQIFGKLMDTLKSSQAAE